MATAVITCPACSSTTEASMPGDSCLWYFECPGCRAMIRPLPGDCCVFCSYSDQLCPPRMAGKCCPPNDVGNENVDDAR